MAPLLATMLRGVAWRLLVRRVALPVAKYQFRRWVASSMTRCPSVLPARYFCSTLPRRIRAIVLVGGWGGYAFSAPTNEGSRAVGVQAWAPIGLSCVTTGKGDRSPYGWTNIWYETYDGWYYWQGHLDPYTVNRYASRLPRC